MMLGGMDSLLGAVLGGVVIGQVLSFGQYYIGGAVQRAAVSQLVITPARVRGNAEHTEEIALRMQHPIGQRRVGQAGSSVTPGTIWLARRSSASTIRGPTSCSAATWRPSV